MRLQINPPTQLTVPRLNLANHLFWYQSRHYDLQPVTGTGKTPLDAVLNNNGVSTGTKLVGDHEHRILWNSHKALEAISPSINGLPVNHEYPALRCHETLFLFLLKKYEKWLKTFII